MDELDKLEELFDIAWDIKVRKKDKNEELVYKTLKYMPDILQQLSCKEGIKAYLESEEE